MGATHLPRLLIAAGIHRADQRLTSYLSRERTTPSGIRVTGGRETVHLNEDCATSARNRMTASGDTTLATVAAQVTNERDANVCACVHATAAAWLFDLATRTDYEVLSWLAAIAGSDGAPHGPVAQVARARVRLASDPGPPDHAGVAALRRTQLDRLTTFVEVTLADHTYRQERARHLYAAVERLEDALYEERGRSSWSLVRQLANSYRELLAEANDDDDLLTAAHRFRVELAERGAVTDATLTAFTVAVDRYTVWVADTRKPLPAIDRIYGYPTEVHPGQPTLMRLPVLALFAADDPSPRLLARDRGYPAATVAEAVTVRPEHGVVTDLIEALVAAAA